MNDGLLLQRGDRVVFYGDSITEQQMYTNYVEAYLASRYPELGLSFFNAGWGGDTAPGGARRLERDVLSLKPTVVTLCFGMNDGQYVPPTDAIREQFVGGMRELVTRLKEKGIRVVLMTPGMADEIANPGLGLANYNTRGLRILADEVLKLAASENLPVCDTHKVMNEVNARGRASDPKFCMAPDGFHPEPAGHLAMAFGLLKALGVPDRRQEVIVDAGSGEVTASPGLIVRLTRKKDGNAVLSMKIDRLPFFVEPAARKVLPFLPFQETFNQLKLRVKGLSKPWAVLRTEHGRSRPFSRQELEDGINLFDQWSLGTGQGAAAVYRYTLEKDQIYFRMWRQLGLNGENGTYYNSAAHHAGIKVNLLLERSRKRLQGGGVLSPRLKITGQDHPGELVANGDFIGTWALRGPFPKPYETDGLGGEAAFTAGTLRLGPEWFRCEQNLAGSVVNLIQVVGPKTDCFVYAATSFGSPVEQTAELLIGSDDGVAAWLNGERVLGRLDVMRGVAADQERIRVPIRKGTNSLLLKITQGAGDWGFCVRFAGLTKALSAVLPVG